MQVNSNKKKKHNNILMLNKSKLNSVENLISEALIDLRISREEFKTIVNEKKRYEKMKESTTMMKSDDELKGNNKNIRKHNGNA